MSKSLEINTESKAAWNIGLLWQGFGSKGVQGWPL